MFCNHDDGNGEGECESCENFETLFDCSNDGLPYLGVESCKQFCFGEGKFELST